MPIRDRITWGPNNPFRDPRLANLPILLHEIRRHQRLPRNVAGARVFDNRDEDLPAKPPGYYHEHDLVPPPTGADRGLLRLVLGNGGEIYLTGDHYEDFRQVINVPELPCRFFANEDEELPAQHDRQYYHDYAWKDEYRFVISRSGQAAIVGDYEGEYGPAGQVVWPWPLLPTPR